MDIMELGAIGELVGGVAVVATLIYVGAQIRQNSGLIEQSARIASGMTAHGTNVSYTSFFGLTAQFPDLAEIYRKGRSGEHMRPLKTPPRGAEDNRPHVWEDARERKGTQKKKVAGGRFVAMF